MASVKNVNVRHLRLVSNVFIFRLLKIMGLTGDITREELLEVLDDWDSVEKSPLMPSNMIAEILGDPIGWLKKYDIMPDDVTIHLMPEHLRIKRSLAGFYNIKLNRVFLPADLKNVKPEVLVHEIGHAVEKTDKAQRAYALYLSKVVHPDHATVSRINRNHNYKKEIDTLRLTHIIFHGYASHLNSRIQGAGSDGGKLFERVLKSGPELISTGLEYAYLNGFKSLFDKDPYLAGLLVYLFPKLKRA